MLFKITIYLSSFKTKPKDYNKTLLFYKSFAKNLNTVLPIMRPRLKII